MSFKKSTFLSTAYLQKRLQLFRLFVFLNILCFIFACSSTSSRAPISYRGQPPSTKVLEHVVASGETLYSIAWRYGLDYKGLARVNRIDAGYRIFPGQIIRLEDNLASNTRVEKAPKAASTSPPKHTVKPQASTSTRETSTTKSPSRSSSVVAATRAEKKPKVLFTPTAAAVDKAAIVWQWPTRGKVITHFNPTRSLKKGIDIEGKKGESVKAAAAGNVVYAGSGLRGYGKLVIIKHSDSYLSAYAHNHRLRVKEGDSVKSGQHIADIGSTGVGVKGKPRLHFQIRRDGKPIDPLPLLPKRKP